MPDQPDDVLKSIKNKLILLDRAMVSTDDNYPTSYHLPLEDLAEFIAEQVQEARIDEAWKKCYTKHHPKTMADVYLSKDEAELTPKENN